MFDKIFSGVVNSQFKTGEVVTITVILPDNISTNIITTNTDSAGKYKVTKSFNIAGNYDAVASIDFDEKYQGSTSEVATFTSGEPNRSTRGLRSVPVKLSPDPLVKREITLIVE
jgi:hypothetical protein